MAFDGITVAALVRELNHTLTREFDTLKFKKAPQSLETGLFFCQLFLLFYIVIFSDM